MNHSADAGLKPSDIDGIATLSCTRQEQAWLRAQQGQAREQLFHEIWTVKEAWLKRGAEAMAPSRMVQLQLSACEAAADCDVRTWAHEGWSLALCAPAQVSLRWDAPAPSPRGFWRVDDAARARVCAPPG